MPLFLWDWTLILLVPAIVLSLYAQYKVKTTFNKYSKVPSAQGLTGAQAARRLLDSAGLQDVQIEAASGRLSDHYDPRSRVLRLSKDGGARTPWLLWESRRTRRAMPCNTPKAMGPCGCVLHSCLPLRWGATWE